MKDAQEDPQERFIGGLRFNHDNRKPPNKLAQAFSAVVIVCLSAILLAGTGVLIAWMVGAVQ